MLGIGGFDTFTVKTTAGDFDTISVILATGSKRKAPAIPGIKELEGRGVSYCAVCDAFFYRGKDVAVLGNSDFALHEAEELAPMAGSVTIYTDERTGVFQEIFFCGEYNENPVCRGRREGVRTASDLSV